MLSKRVLNRTLVYQINREEAPPGKSRRPPIRGLLQHVLTVLVFWSWVLPRPRLPTLSRSLRLPPWASILLYGRLGSCLDLLPAAPPIGHPQTCVYPDVCLGIAHVSGKAPSLGTREKRRYTMYLPLSPYKGADTLCICPFPLTRERGFTRYMHNP